MSEFIEIRPEEFNQSPFRMIGRDWMLITAEHDSKINAMTASWGGFGVMWSKNVAFIVIRPQRYTKQFVDNSDRFSLCFFDSTYRKQLNYIGSVSGRNENKIEKAQLSVLYMDNTPYYEEAKTVIFCRKLYAQEFRPECFIAGELNDKWYPDSDHHTLYISEVAKILSKKSDPAEV
jgi:flavin reductase (DIM6/NTAB) family NADH-FMN oxidoreductase RutF